MRSWHPIPPSALDRRRLLGEHNELHAMRTVLVRLRAWLAAPVGKRPGYSSHPEVVRWYDHEGALRARHDAVVAEMLARGYRHESPLELDGGLYWPDVVEPVEVMRAKLAAKIAAPVDKDGAARIARARLGEPG